MTLPQPTTTSETSDDRWKFVRDVAVFQLKLFLDNVRDLVLMPVSLIAALIDLVFRGEREGSLFYKVLRWGAHSEEVIDVYSAIEHHPPGDFKVNPGYTVDGVIARLENVLKREVEKGGTAASAKAAMDRAIDQLHTETSAKREQARDMVVRTTDELRKKFERGPSDT
jgi:hypothetical protein